MLVLMCRLRSKFLSLFQSVLAPNCSDVVDDTDSVLTTNNSLDSEVFQYEGWAPFGKSCKVKEYIKCCKMCSDESV